MATGRRWGSWRCRAPRTRPSAHPLDVLGAQTEGMIGYVIEQELGNILPFEQPFATILSMVEVDPHDPAFANPSKPIGPFYSEEDAARLGAEKGWTMARDGDRFRRVVPSPLPIRIFQIRPVKWLLEHGCIVICAGGGGIPTLYGADGKLHGVEAVVDKDRASALCPELEADLFIMATDADAVYLDWESPDSAPSAAPRRRGSRSTPSPMARWDRRSRRRSISPAAPASPPPSARSAPLSRSSAARRARGSSRPNPEPPEPKRQPSASSSTPLPVRPERRPPPPPAPPPSDGERLGLRQAAMRTVDSARGDGAAAAAAVLEDRLAQEEVGEDADHVGDEEGDQGPRTGRMPRRRASP